MKNLQALSTQEMKNIQGGYHDIDLKGCLPGPIIVIGPTTGPTFPNPDTIIF